MSAASVEVREVRIGRIFERAFATFGDNVILMLGIALFLGAIPQALSSYAFNLYAPHAAKGAYILTGRGAAATAGSLFVDVLFSAIVNAALIYATVEHSDGRRASLGECLDKAASVFLPLVGLSILYVLGLILGFVFLVIPGLMLWCIWFVAEPVLVTERTSIIRAFGRSKELTAFEGWKMLGILLVVLATTVLAGELVRFIIRAIEGSDPVITRSVPYLLLMLPVSTLTSLAWPTLEAAAYIELRNAKDGAPVDRLQEVFA